MRVTKWGEYGILCSMYLARHFADGPVGAAEIAEKQLIPLQYTQQILQRLRKGGVIKSARGPKGGFSLTAPPEEITLRQILYAAEGNTFEVICDSHPVYEKCAQGPCGLSAVWRELKRSVDDLLESRTLAWVISRENSEGTLVPSPVKSIAPAGG